MNVEVKVEVNVGVLVGGTGVLLFVAVGVLVSVGVLVKVLVAVKVKVRVGVGVKVGVEPPTVMQALVPPMALQMPVTEGSVAGKAWPVSHMPIPIRPWPMAQLIFVQ